MHEKETGLLSLTGLEYTLGEAIESARQYQLKHAFICIKLEDTLSIKENYSSAIYNKLRIKLSENIVHTLRHNDAIGWLSYNKLGLLIEDCNNEQAQNIIGQITRVIRETKATIDEIPLQLDANITLTMVTSDTLSVSSIIKSTDRIDHEAVSTSV
jgi:GGDEF domain-containing protein